MFRIVCRAIFTVIALGMTSGASLADTAIRVPGMLTPLGPWEVQDQIGILQNTPIRGRCEWYRQKLGSYEAAINASARRNGVPAQLLTAVILNELADIGTSDVVQDNDLIRSCSGAASRPVTSFIRSVEEQSYGIAQVTPKTAMRHRAVDIPAHEQRRAPLFVACALLHRPTAIEASARILRNLMIRMQQTSHGPLMQSRIAPGRRFDPSRPYDGLYVLPRDLQRASPQMMTNVFGRAERDLARLAGSVYNSERFLGLLSHEVKDGRYYKDARKHGDNAAAIASDLYENRDCGLRLDRVRHRVSNAPPPRAPAPPVTGPSSSRNPEALRNCLCACNQGRTNFSCSYNTTDYPGFSQGGSPSCAKAENGPCLCRAFGCFRAQPVQSGECHRTCMSKHGG